MKSNLVNILYCLCFCLQLNQVLGSRQGSSTQRFSQYRNRGGSTGNVDYSGSHAAFDSTISTEMSYVDSASKKEKKGNPHAEYEYIGAGGYLPKASPPPKGSPPPKAGKKHDYTHEPTDYGYSVAPTYHPSPPPKKGSKKGCYYDDEITLGPTHMGKGKGKGSKSGSLPSKKACKSVKSSKKGSYFPSAVPCKLMHVY